MFRLGLASSQTRMGSTSDQREATVLLPLHLQKETFPAHPLKVMTNITNQKYQVQNLKNLP